MTQKATTKKNDSTAETEIMPVKPTAEEVKNEDPAETESEMKQNPMQACRENGELEKINAELENMLSDLSDRVQVVVIPYKKTEAQGNELQLALRGWDHHFKENFKMVVVGDREDYFSEEVIYIPHECSDENPPLDLISKLLAVIEELPEIQGLVLANDDIYPVNDFDLGDVKFLKCDGLLTDRKSTGELYALNRKKTLETLLQEKRTVYDYGCHLPVYLNTEQLLELVDKFDLTHQAMLMSSLYFNYFYPARIPFKLDLSTDNLKVGVYRENADLNKLSEFIPRKIFVNNSTTGWTPGLQKLLEKRLTRCRFEK